METRIPLMGCWVANNGYIASESLTKINNLHEKLATHRRFIEKFLQQVVYPARDPNKPKLSTFLLVTQTKTSTRSNE